jgi:hypothetical protein
MGIAERAPTASLLLGTLPGKGGRGKVVAAFAGTTASRDDAE